MKLVIVESPTKAKTISKFLGKDYKVESSFGHIMDLPKTTLGVDVDNNYEPQYLVSVKAKKIASHLKTLANQADEIILATDEDREGEAISWHLAEILKIKPENIKRIVFHEITKSAITKALANPRKLDKNLINAQQARRVLDRLVGYKLSPFLWGKIARGLSAGRVQSVSVRLVVEREEEIKKFKTQEYWSIKALLQTDPSSSKDYDETSAKESFEATLIKIDSKTLKKFDINNAKQADEIKAKLDKAVYKVTNIEKKQTTKSPLPPFTTATLQQTANARLGFSAKQTMVVAQKLYETGLITYMRTDSVNLSKEFVANARDYIKTNFGEKYLSPEARVYKSKSKNSQEAHEAIRPTDPNILDTKITDSGQKRLYNLIWQRALATQAAKATLDNTHIDIEANSDKIYNLRSTGQIIKFDGYLKIYPQTTKENTLPDVDTKTKVYLDKIITEQHMTEPPARYSDATLVKALEKHDIGRPSTYAPTISTIINRNYVERDDKKRLAPTEVAFIVNKLLVEHFPEIVDYEFTADLEEELDDIAEGKVTWQKTIDNFYKPFAKNLMTKDKELDKKALTEEKTDEVCEACNSPMIIKVGRFGKFMACTNYPDCKNTKQIQNGNINKDNQPDDKKLDEFAAKYKDAICSKCSSKMVAKTGKFGPFMACSSYPKCKNILDTNGTGVKCTQCSTGEISQKRSKRGVFYACNQYPDCKLALWGKPTGKQCEVCHSLMIESKDGVKCSNKDCG